MTEVTAKMGKEADAIGATVAVDLGVDCDDAIARFGKEVVFSNYVANVRITVQSAIRRYLEKGLNQEQIQEKLAGYTPGVQLERVVDPIATLQRRLEALTPEEKEEAIKKLMERLTAGQ